MRNGRPSDDSRVIDLTNSGEGIAGLPRLALTPRLVGLVVASSLVQGATVVPVPLIIREIFDVAIPSGDVDRLVLLGVLLITVMVASAGLAIVLRHLILKVIQSHLSRVRSEVVATLVAVAMPAIASRDEDDVRDVMVQDSLRYSAMASTVASELVPSVITAIAVGAVLVYMDPILFLVTAMLMIPVVLVHRLLGGTLDDRTAAYHQALRSSAGSISRLYRRAAVTRVHGAQHLEIDHQDGRIDDLEVTAVRLDLVRSVYQWTLQSLIVFSALAVLIVGGAGVIDGSRSLGELFAFYAAVSLVRPALDTAVRSMPTITAGRMARRRLDELAMLDDTRTPGGSLPAPTAPVIELERVEFDYGPVPILREISFAVAPGTVTVVRGPNGAGKTTLIRLICGLQFPTGGRILLGGVPLDQVDLATFRRQIGVVFQEAIVAGETVREALSYGDHEVPDAAVEDALRVTGFDRILARLPEGLDTRLGAAGVQLSGGERQRLAIAQALVRRPTLLLLDEPTNHLDAEAVAAVVSALPENGPAVVVVTHEDSRRFAPDQIIELPLRPGAVDRHDPVTRQPAPKRTGRTPMTEPSTTDVILRFVRTEGTFEMEVEGHTVVVDRVSEQMITLNGVAGLIWNRIASPSTVAEIVEECHRRYPVVAAEQIEADVVEFLDHAAAVGIVAPAR